MPLEAVIRRTPRFTRTAALCLAVAILASNTLAEDGVTNIIDSTANIGGIYMVGTNGAFNGLIITNGGGLTSVQGIIGNSASSSNNSAIITGIGSFWTNSTSLILGRTGSWNYLTISNGGQIVHTNGSGSVGHDSIANYNTVLVTDTGSVWSLHNLAIGYRGSYNQMVVTNGARVVGDEPNYGVGVVLLPPNSTNVLFVGSSIGSGPGASFNSVLVSGAGSVWSNNYSLDVGRSGSSNSLTIVNGGQVFNNGLSVGGREPLQDSGGSNNSVLISGTDSILVNNGMMSVGVTGSGNKLTLANGATVLDYGPDNLYNAEYPGLQNVGGAYIGGNSQHPSGSASNNSIFISGFGTLWSNSYSVYVGYSGSENSLIVTNGGRLFNTSGFIGYSNGANDNIALVTGLGSVWSNSDTMVVGRGGTGNRLTIADSGAVISSNIVVGATAASTENAVTVSGGYLYATNSAGTGFLDVRRGSVTLNTGTVVVNQLYLTNNASSVMTFGAGLLRSGGTIVSNGTAFLVGDGVQSATYDMNGGTHTFSDGLMLSTNSSLIGNGSIVGSVTNFGIIAPGHSVGSIDITGGLTLTNTSELDMEIAGTGSNDQLDISGLLKAGGLLNVTLTDGYTGNAGDSFNLFNFGSLSGTFAQTNLPALGGGLWWNTGNLYTLGEIQIVPEPSACALLLAGAGALWLRRRKR